MGTALGAVGGLKNETFSIFGATISWGNFIGVFINFVVIVLVVFMAFKLLRLDKLQRPKQ